MNELFQLLAVDDAVDNTFRLVLEAKAGCQTSKSISTSVTVAIQASHSTYSGLV